MISMRCGYRSGGEGRGVTNSRRKASPNMKDFLEKNGGTALGSNQIHQDDDSLLATQAYGDADGSDCTQEKTRKIKGDNKIIAECGAGKNAQGN